MGLYRSVRAVANATGDGAVDWTAVVDAATAATDPGELSLSLADRRGYATDVRAAHDRIQTVSGHSFAVPETVTIQNRHHWLEANAATFRRVLAPLDTQPSRLAGVARVANTGSTAAALAFLANNVLGQYDPKLFADDGSPHLYIVHPNMVRVATTLEVDRDRFRRWIVFHEVAHAAEFGAAPWLAPHIETLVEDSVTALRDGQLRSESFAALNSVMTVVEGYAELLMDRAFDREYADLRAALDARRRGGGPLTRVLRRVFGVGLKREQYERGTAFFEEVIDLTDMATASRVWDSESTLPTEAELDDPAAWVTRVDAG
ncbi:MAG: zinc-dependent metalloprotease [Halobacteriaceae archaeon]